jgi:hypothetical protein
MVSEGICGGDLELIDSVNHSHSRASASRMAAALDIDRFPGVQSSPSGFSMYGT